MVHSSVSYYSCRCEFKESYRYIAIILPTQTYQVSIWVAFLVSEYGCKHDFTEMDYVDNYNMHVLETKEIFKILIN